MISKNAKWIKAPQIETVPCFIKNITIFSDLQKVELDITAMGFYRVFINGNDITTNLFMPGYTSFQNRVQVQTYDLTAFFTVGNNEIKILLGNGWGGAKRFGWMHGNHPYFDPSLLFSFSFHYSNKKEELVSSSDLDCFTSHIIFSEIYDGEIQDKNQETKYIGKAELSDIKTKLVGNIGEDIVEGERIYPKELIITPKKEVVIDFGQNFTGYINVIAKGKKGEKISFVPSEILDKDGNFYNANYRSAKSFFSYTLTGKEDNFKPLFSFQGLRYIKLIDYPNNITKDNFIGIMVHSNIERTGSFVCGNELVNQLYHNIIYGQLSNYLDIPTDCPQRDERLGWLGDAQVFVRTAAINFNVYKFFKKWLGDMALDQHEDGGVEGVAPKVGGLPIQVSSGWGDAATICPIEIYNAYGNKEILEESYEMMTKWVNYVNGRCINKPYIWDTDPQFGDWLSQDAPYGETVGSTSLPLINTAFFYYSTCNVIKAGLVLSKDVSYYQELKENIKKAFISEFLDGGKPKGNKALLNYKGERTPYTQTGLSLILYFGLCKEKDKKNLAKLLKDLVVENEMRMTTGFLGTPYILHALSDNGYSDIAYNLLLQEKRPSWLYSVLQGATTIWEHWDGVDEDGNIWSEGMNSFNHYAYGAVFDWIFSNTLGIKLIKPGYKEVMIDVIPDKRLGFAKGGIITKYGKLSVNWYYQDESLKLEVEIPSNTIAKIKLKDRIVEVEGGKYSFTY